MSEEKNILIFAGSTRAQSYNKQLARLAERYVKSQGLGATLLDLSEYPLPLYDGDIELKCAYPDNAQWIKNLMQTHQGIFIISPEYNGSLTGVLKNTLDWVSRSSNAT